MRPLAISRTENVSTWERMGGMIYTRVKILFNTNNHFNSNLDIDDHGNKGALLPREAAMIADCIVKLTELVLKEMRTEKRDAKI